MHHLLTFNQVSEKSDIDNKEKVFHPELTHQIFNDEKIEGTWLPYLFSFLLSLTCSHNSFQKFENLIEFLGYKGLQVELYYSPAGTQSYLGKIVNSQF